MFDITTRDRPVGFVLVEIMHTQTKAEKYFNFRAGSMCGFYDLVQVYGTGEIIRAANIGWRELDQPM